MDILTQKIAENRAVLCEWLAAEYAKTPAHLYSSVDVRYSGYKIAPVDTNIFPAGFNNLNKMAQKQGVAAFKSFFKERALIFKTIVIIPENHTRNQGYITNLIVLYKMLEQAGYQVLVGRVDDTVHEPLTLEGLQGETIVSYPLIKKGNYVETCHGIRPDILVMNMDMTSGIPALLQDVMQPIYPSVKMGWFQRRKSTHFEQYKLVAEEAAKILDIHPWLLDALYQRCGMVNFKERTGLECVALNVERVIHALKDLYKEFGVQEEPYVFIKADSGTYGMGIMTAHSGDDVLTMNKKIRNKMDVIKEGAQNTEVIIQEGIPTINVKDGKVSEPFVYLINGKAIGGIWRMNAGRDAFISLNATGVEFAAIDADFGLDKAQNEILSYSFTASLAALAAARECYC